MFSLRAFLCALIAISGANALQLVSPSTGFNYDPTQPLTVQWTATPAEISVAPAFDILLFNPSHNAAAPTTHLIIQQNVPSAAGTFTTTWATGASLPVTNGYIVGLVASANPDMILVAGGEFNVVAAGAAPPVKSVATTSSLSSTSIATTPSSSASSTTPTSSSTSTSTSLITSSSVSSVVTSSTRPSSSASSSASSSVSSSSSAASQFFPVVSSGSSGPGPEITGAVAPGGPGEQFALGYENSGFRTGLDDRIMVLVGLGTLAFWMM